MHKMSFFVAAIALTGCSSGTQTTVEQEKEQEAVTSKYQAGATIYEDNCVACHQAWGEGVKGAFPPLAGSDYLLADKNRAIHQIIHGSSGEMTVNGEKYDAIMPAQPISDEEVRDVMNYILNAWGNNGGEVTLEDVKAQR